MAVPQDGRPFRFSAQPLFYRCVMYVVYMLLGLLVGLPFAGVFYYAIWMFLAGGDPGGGDSSPF
jgi:hypothetical protein